MTYTYDYPQSSVCGATLIFSKAARPGDPVTLKLVTSFRAAHLGGGRSLAAGGFEEVKNVPPIAGAIVEGDAERYREMVEELGDEITEILPYEDYCARVVYLRDCLQNTGKPSSDGTPLINKIIQKTLEVTPAELRKISKLGYTNEQMGLKVEDFTIDPSNQVPFDEKKTRTRLKDFANEIEVDAVVLWLRQQYQQIYSGYTRFDL